jgi:hypothetical protein
MSCSTLRYTARDAGNLKADAVQHLHDDVLQDPHTWPTSSA